MNSARPLIGLVTGCLIVFPFSTRADVIAASDGRLDVRPGLTPNLPPAAVWKPFVHAQAGNKTGRRDELEVLPDPLNAIVPKNNSVLPVISLKVPERFRRNWQGASIGDVPKFPAAGEYTFGAIMLDVNVPNTKSLAVADSGLLIPERARRGLVEVS